MTKKALRAAAAAGLLAWGLATLPASSYSPPFHPDHNAEFLNPGEMLLHRVHSPHTYADNLHLPMSSLLAAFIENHSSPESWKTWRLLDGAAALLLVLAIGLQSGGWSQALAGAALMLAAPHFFPSAGSLRAPSWHGAYIYFHSFYFLLLATAAGLAVWRARAPTPWRSLALGLALGATLLYRSTLVFFPPLLALHDRLHGRRSWKDLACVCLVPYLFLLPWIGMNLRLHHRFVPLEAGEASQNLVSGAMGLVEKYDTGGDWRALLPKTGGSAFSWAAGEVARHPLRYAAGCARRLGFVFRLQPVLLPLALLASVLRWRKREVQPVALLAAYLVGIHCFMAVLPEYFEPAAPLLAVLAAALLPPGSRDRKFSPAVLGGAFCLSLAFSAFTLCVVAAYALAPERGLDAAVAKNPDDAWLLYERGLRRGAASAEGITDLSRSLALRPDYEQRAGVLAWARLVAGEAGPFLDWQAAHDPEPFTETGFLKAEGLLRLGRKADIQGRFFNEPSPACGFGADFVLEQTRAWLGARPPGESLRFIAASAAAAPACARLLLAEAELASRAGDAKTAKAALRRASRLQLDADEKRAAAGASAALGDYDAALALDESGWLEFARRAAEDHHKEAALAILRRAEARGPDLEQSLSMAWLYSSLGETRSAMRLLDAAASRPGGKARALNDRGVLSAQLGRTDDAVRDLRAAIEIAPAKLSAYATLGGLYVSSGRTEEALKLYDAALAQSSSPEEAELRKTIQADRDKLKEKK